MINFVHQATRHKSFNPNHSSADTKLVNYSDSLLLIDRLKNTIWPHTDEWAIIFYFTSNTEFKISFVERKNLAHQVMQMEAGWGYDVPHAKMWIQDEQIFFHFSDNNIFEYSYDLMFNKSSDNMVLSERFSTWEFKRALKTAAGL